MKVGIVKGIETIINYPNIEEAEMVFQIKNLIYQSAVNNIKPRDSKSIQELVAENLPILKNGKANETVIKTQFKDLDLAVGGFSMGELNVIAGRPGMGKTVLLANLVLHISRTFPVLYFSFDLSESLLTNRFLSTLSKIPIQKILQNTLTEEETKRIILAQETINGHQIFINSSCNNSMILFKEQCVKQINENGIKVIVVDYIQMMGSNRNRNNREIELSYISRELKNIAKDYEVCVVVTSTLSRNAERREGNLPQLSDLSESGAIEQNADKVIMVYRPDYYGLKEDYIGLSTLNMMELLIRKNRNGPLSDIKLNVDSEFTTVSDFDPFRSEFTFSTERLDEFYEPPF